MLKQINRRFTNEKNVCRWFWELWLVSKISVDFIWFFVPFVCFWAINGDDKDHAMENRRFTKTKSSTHFMITNKHVNSLVHFIKQEQTVNRHCYLEVATTLRDAVSKRCSELTLNTVTISSAWCTVFLAK